MLRQQVDHGDGDDRPNRSLADFIAPHDTGIADHLGGFAVTAGIGADELAKSFEADHDDYRAIMVKALADRLAEAFAEWLHREVRRAWYAPDEALPNEDLIEERYRGIRPAFGYPACPDHTEKRTLFDLLGARDQGMDLTTSCAMSPERRLRAVLRASIRALLQRRAHREGPGRGLRPSQGPEPDRDRAVAPREPGVRTGVTSRAGSATEANGTPPEPAGSVPEDDNLLAPVRGHGSVEATGAITLVRGEGAYVVDDTGRRYLDATGLALVLQRRLGPRRDRRRGRRTDARAAPRTPPSATSRTVPPRRSRLAASLALSRTRRSSSRAAARTRSTRPRRWLVATGSSAASPSARCSSAREGLSRHAHGGHVARRRSRPTPWATAS